MARKQSNKQSRKQTSSQSGNTPIAGTYEGEYSVIELEADSYTTDGWLISINGVPSSHIVLGQPQALEFEYMRWIATGARAFIDAHLDASKLRITHLGGGACTLARYFADVYPQSRNTVVELDAELARLSREWFDIPRAPRVKIRVDDARAVAESFTPASRDVIIRDVFAGAVTPNSFTTVEFFEHCHRGLAPGGLYLANCGDHPDLRGAKSELAGMLEVFQHVAVIADPPMLKGRRYGNIILLGSDTEFFNSTSTEAAAITRELLGGGVPAQYKDESWVRKFASGAQPRHDEVANLQMLSDTPQPLAEIQENSDIEP
ncbi:spermidine synthase [Corynebacterium suranareeae]|uniref:Spermidine synthase n=1 Tax=Corynebacterium suranareeae TaxID=2506452 RepID=A0A160PT38_9CORY|nr:spermidine synthase [Corynebacterium suranareeae]BAU95620.1 spermidine synthase [Corynebacterium suranareeae]